MEPYESLANAIIIQAAKDYRKVIRFLKRHPHTPDLDTEEAEKDPVKKAQKEIILEKEAEQDDIERFFRSEWFELLSELDGEALLRRIRSMEVS